MTSIRPGDAIHEWKRLDGVDVLRGLAILFVLLNHVNMRLRLAHVPYGQALPEQVLSSLVWNAQRGVQMFFVVSGFLITTTSLRRWQTLPQVDVRGFYRLRFARIAPLLLLLLALLSGLHLAQINHYVVAARTGGLGSALLAALTFHVNVLEAHRGYLPANWDILWSLSVEEMFYLFFPLAAHWLGRGRMFVALLCGLIVLGPFSRTWFAHGSEIWHEYSYLGGMDAIALGCLTALLVWKFRFAHSSLRWIGGIGVAVVAACLCFSLRLESWGLERTGLDMSLLALGTAMIIVAAAQSGWRGPQVLVPLLALGRCSYEIYLTHMFVVFAFFDLFLAAGRPSRLVPVLFLAVVVLSGMVGIAVSRFYSEPANRRLRQVRSSPRVATVVAS